MYKITIIKVKEKYLYTLIYMLQYMDRGVDATKIKM